MQNPLVPEPVLRKMRELIRGFAAERRASYNVDLDDPEYGPAFANYLFFSFLSVVQRYPRRWYGWAGEILQRLLLVSAFCEASYQKTRIRCGLGAAGLQNVGRG